MGGFHEIASRRFKKFIVSEISFEVNSDKKKINENLPTGTKALTTDRTLCSTRLFGMKRKAGPILFLCGCCCPMVKFPFKWTSEGNCELGGADNSSWWGTELRLELGGNTFPSCAIYSAGVAFNIGLGVPSERIVCGSPCSGFLSKETRRTKTFMSAARNHVFSIRKS